MSIETATLSARSVLSEMQSYVLGQDKVLETLLVTVLSGGHALMVGMPGLAKTKLASCMATLLGLSMNRVQCTPDLMPSDILGSEVYDAGAEHPFRFIPGPVFTNILLVDEINRASPRTQSALLQAMQENAVTIGGKTFALPKPFHVLATQNPLEHLGTYPLPEAQLDRFMSNIKIDYPDPKIEEAILINTTTSQEKTPKMSLQSQSLQQLQQIVHDMPIGQNVVQFIVKICQSTRQESVLSTDIVKKYVIFGAGIRAGQALMLAIRASAIIQGRFAPTDEDVIALAPAILRHRMGLSHYAVRDNVSIDDVLSAVLSVG